jgi:uncharacterized protein
MTYKEKLLANATFRELTETLSRLEGDRVYCKHDMIHFRKVEEISLWLWKENGLDFDSEVLSLLAYLHDLGRVVQYQTGTPHSEASAVCARTLLNEIGYPEEQQQVIFQAITGHGHRKNAQVAWKQRTALRTPEEILQFADQFSRNCYQCPAAAGCKWSEQQKIFHIKERTQEDVYWQS